MGGGGCQLNTNVLSTAVTHDRISMIFDFLIVYRKRPIKNCWGHVIFWPWTTHGIIYYFGRNWRILYSPKSSPKIQSKK